MRRLLLAARDAGYIYKKLYEGRATAFLDNAYVTESTEPVDCPLWQAVRREIVSEENYFFKLSAFQDKLLKLYEEQPDFIRPAFRRNEIVRFVEAVAAGYFGQPQDREVGSAVARRSRARHLRSGTTRSPAIWSGIGYGDDELQSSENIGRRSCT